MVPSLELVLVDGMAAVVLILVLGPSTCWMTVWELCTFHDKFSFSYESILLNLQF